MKWAKSKWGGGCSWYELWIYQLRDLATATIIIVQADGRPPAGPVLFEISVKKAFFSLVTFHIIVCTWGKCWVSINKSISEFGLDLLQLESVIRYRLVWIGTPQITTDWLIVRVCEMNRLAGKRTFYILSLEIFSGSCDHFATFGWGAATQKVICENVWNMISSWEVTSQKMVLSPEHTLCLAKWIDSQCVYIKFEKVRLFWNQTFKVKRRWQRRY